MTAVAKAEKPAADLTSVTPAPEAIKPPDIDTTTPADTSVLPFTEIYMNKWTPYLTSKLNIVWPHIHSANAVGLIRQHINDRGSLIVRGRGAILLCVLTREPLEPRPIVDVIFCFRFFKDEGEEIKDIRTLIHHAERWGMQQGARLIRVQNEKAIEIPPSRMKEILGATALRKSVLIKEF